MKSDNVHRYSGSNFTGALAITFIVLKLTGVIDWPWLWVLSPIWISLCIVAVIVLVLLVIKMIKERQIKY